MKTFSRRITIIILVTLLWITLLASNIIPQIRGDYGWRWPYEVPTAPQRLFPLIAGLLLYALVAARLKASKRVGWLLLWAITGTICLTLATLFVTSDPFFKLYTVTLSPNTGGWHYAAVHVQDLATTLGDWPNYMQYAFSHISGHLGISPPGMVVSHYIFNQLLEQFPAISNWLAPPLRAAQCHNYQVNDYTNAQLASTWLGILMPLWAGLTVLPMYWLGRRLFGESSARWAVCWWPLLPGLLMFSPVINTAFPFLATILIAILLKGLLNNRPAWVVAAGIFFSIITFLMFAFLPLALVAGVLTLGLYIARTRLSDALALREVTWQWPFQMGFWFVLGSSTVWLIYYVLYRVTLFDILQVATTAHLELERSYWPWLFLHAYDYFIFSGWPFVLLAGIGVWGTFQKWHKQLPLLAGDVFTLSLTASFFILIVSGTLRGETGRILLYLSPFLLLMAAATMVERSDDSPREGWKVTAVQMVTIIVMVAFLRVVDAQFNTPPPIIPPIAVIPPPQLIIPNGVVFDNTLHLPAFAGYSSWELSDDGQPQPVLNLWLNWESTGQVDTPYWFSFIPVSSTGDAALEAMLEQPANWTFPTTCMRPESGSVWTYTQIPLFTDAEEWWVSLSLVDSQGEAKAAVQNPDGSEDDQVGLGPFRARP